jgi:hypothetical protein
MGWNDEHMRRVAELADNVQLAHRHSIDHRAEILASGSCGCFYCCAIFPPARIRAWTDAIGSGEGQTALCPECGIDSVIGDCSGIPVTGEFLTEMHAYWF